MLPTLDEAKGLEVVAKNIPRQKLKDMGWNYQVWVVDGGSTDETKSISIENNF